nr:hypothetical protein [Kitasatospora cineracea]
MRMPVHFSGAVVAFPRVSRSPSRQAPEPSSAVYAVRAQGCQIQAATVSPRRTSEAITA